MPEPDENQRMLAIGDAFTELIALIPADEQSRLLPGLSAQAIAELEAELAAVRPGAELPDALKALYAICGGQEKTDYESLLFAAYPLAFTLLPLPLAVAVYRELHAAYEQYFRPSDPPDAAYPWFDTRCFPFGWSPGESGCVRCIHLETGQIYFFDDDGGLAHAPDYDGLLAVLREAARIHREKGWYEG
ncbi:MAG TPA: SMI1/KNR4 family protein [Herpetosiphonaceae bacterium]|nr:SMI1/KNR4 family protein [Herpetosiphonaceae bacterium]